MAVGVGRGVSVVGTGVALGSSVAAVPHPTSNWLVIRITLIIHGVIWACFFRIEFASLLTNL